MLWPEQHHWNWPLYYNYNLPRGWH